MWPRGPVGPLRDLRAAERLCWVRGARVLTIPLRYPSAREAARFLSNPTLRPPRAALFLQAPPHPVPDPASAQARPPTFRQ